MTLNGGWLYPVHYAGATERPWASLNKLSMFNTSFIFINHHITELYNSVYIITYYGDQQYWKVIWLETLGNVGRYVGMESIAL